jgi:hypothetical protein
MTSMSLRTMVLLTALIVAMALPADRVTAQSLPAPDPVQRTWMRTDQPVARGVTERTWMWGPVDSGYQTIEPYVESPGGERVVTYFDKSRMEVTRPGGERSSDWYVTNGLLVVELMSGRLQTGDDSFEDLQPAAVNVAGDPDDASGPTYATFATLRDLPARGPGDAIITRVSRDGSLIDDMTLASFDAIAAERVTVPGIDHSVASPFWDFMLSSGAIYDSWQYIEAPLFPNPFYATGQPVTEAYWASVKVGGTYRDVLLQCFERRCLTWAPDNPEGWQVEAGNVGMHYYLWRYGEPRPEPQHLQVTFNLYHEQVLIATTLTHETFFGTLAAGTWETRDPSGTLLSIGSLWAEHSATTISAVIVQDGPVPGWGLLEFNLRFTLGGLTGDGTFEYVVETPTGTQSGSVSLTARAAAVNSFDVSLSEIPPVLFTGP